MGLATRIVIVLVCVTYAVACSVKRDLTSLGSNVADDLDDNSCVLYRLTDRSKKLDFKPGTGKPYSVGFRIQVGEHRCSTKAAKIDVQWRDLEIDEIADSGKSKIRLTGRASVFIEDSQLVCNTRDLLIAYSDWYEVSSLSLTEFRSPENPQDPAVASEVAFERFLGKFTGFFIQECL